VLSLPPYAFPMRPTYQTIRSIYSLSYNAYQSDVTRKASCFQSTPFSGMMLRGLQIGHDVGPGA
jgi:hypothetical protein